MLYLNYIYAARGRPGERPARAILRVLHLREADVGGHAPLVVADTRIIVLQLITTTTTTTTNTNTTNTIAIVLILCTIVIYTYDTSTN